MNARLRRCAVVVGIALVCVAWLVISRDPSPDVRRWFGLWRTRQILVALGLAWAAVMSLLHFASPRALARGFLVTFSAALCWVVLEVGGAIGLVSYARLLGQEHADPLGSKPLPHADIRGRTRGDIAAGWGVPAEDIEFHYVADRRGFRNGADREAADLYLLGDSILVAGLLPFEDTVTSRLEKDLGRPAMNIALIGLSPEAERDLFRDAHVPVAGRLVLQFVFEDNDLIDSEVFRRRAAEPSAEPRRYESVLDRSLSRNLELWFLSHTQPIHPVAARFTGLIGANPYYFAYAKDTMQGHDGELPYIGAALEETRDDVVRGGGHYGVVFVPSKLRILGPLCRWPANSDLADYPQQLSPLPEFLRDWARKNNVPYLDSTQAFAERAASGEIPFFPADTHPNAAGHVALERAITQWDVLRDWNSSSHRDRRVTPIEE